MSRKKPLRSLPPDDDVELFFDDEPEVAVPRPQARPTYRKTLQLCRQVEHQLAYALGSCADPVLGQLTVASVVPAPNAGRLLVTVECPIDLAVLIALERLKQARTWLRTELAPAIRRRRVPELMFVCAPAETGG